MSDPQIIITESGEELVVLSRREYDALLARLGDEAAEDRMSVRILKERARDVALPISLWEEIEAASSPIGPIRKWRGLTQAELATLARISQGFLSEIESGKKSGDLSTLRAIASALNVGLEDVTPEPA